MNQHPSGSSLTGGTGQGLDLVKDLAMLERDLAKKLDQARQTAKSRIASAEEEVRHILDEAEVQIRQMEDTLKAELAEERKKYEEEARALAKAESKRIREQAELNRDHAVSFVLSEVLP